MHERRPGVCPACGEQPFTWPRYAFKMMLRGRCQGCGTELRLHLPRWKLLAGFAIGLAGVALVFRYFEGWWLVAMLAAVTVTALALDYVTWRGAHWQIVAAAPARASAAAAGEPQP